MIDNSIVCFPNNVIAMLGSALQTIDPPSTPGGDDGLRIELRPLQSTDYTETVAITPGVWTPNDQSMEVGMHEPTLQNYTVIVETLVTDMDQARGIATHSLLSTLVRSTLYRDPGIRVGLPLLRVELGGYVEQLERWKVNQQQFMSTKGTGGYAYLSALELHIETSIKKA